MGQTGAGDHDGQVKDKARRSGQIQTESRRGHRHRAWRSSTQEHRNDTHRSDFLVEPGQITHSVWTASSGNRRTTLARSAARRRRTRSACRGGGTAEGQSGGRSHERRRRPVGPEHVPPIVHTTLNGATVELASRGTGSATTRSPPYAVYTRPNGSCSTRHCGICPRLPPIGPTLCQETTETLNGTVAVVHLLREGATMTNPDVSDAKRSKGVRTTSDPRSEADQAARRRTRSTATRVADTATSRVKGVATKANRVATGRTNPPDNSGRAAPKASKPRAAAVKNLAAKGAGAVEGGTGAVDSTLRGTTGAVQSTVSSAAGTAVSTLRTGIGAGLSLLVNKALLLLQLLKWIARKVIEALRGLARRLREYGGVKTHDPADVDDDDELERDGSRTGGRSNRS